MKGSWPGRSTYDTHDRETERVSFNENGEVTSRTVWRYDAAGHLTKAITYHGEEIAFLDTFKYDENGRKIRGDYFKADGSRREYDIFVYDSRGLLREVTHSEGTLQYRDTYK